MEELRGAMFSAFSMGRQPSPWRCRSAIYCFGCCGGLQRRLLWRVRCKLIVSYVLIGFVPALLIVAFFRLAGVFMLLTVSSYLATNGLNDVVDEAAVLAQGAVREIWQAGGPEGAEPAENAARAILERRLAARGPHWPPER